MDVSWLGPPIDARPLFAGERSALLALLRGLSEEQWRATAVPGWSVRDLAAHLLGDDYGRIARERDGHSDGAEPRPGESFEAFIHRNNEEWVRGTARMSPASLLEALEVTGRSVAALWWRGDPEGPGLGVSWAGASPAPRWLDCARDLTEYWTHRQQIRNAVGLDTEVDPAVAAPVLDTFMRALPHTLADVDAPTGTAARVEVTGPVVGIWNVVRTAPGWVMGTQKDGPPAAGVRMGFETAWRLCTRGITPVEAVSRARFDGDRALGEACCRIVSVIH